MGGAGLSAQLARRRDACRAFDPEFRVDNPARPFGRSASEIETAAPEFQLEATPIARFAAQAGLPVLIARRTRPDPALRGENGTARPVGAVGRSGPRVGQSVSSILIRLLIRPFDS